MSERAHIFVVDDEAPAREMVADYLRLHGFEATACDCGASLRAALLRQRPNLIVLDLNMPEEDGLTILRDLKQRTAVPIIMLTATAGASSSTTKMCARSLIAAPSLPRPQPASGW